MIDQIAAYRDEYQHVPRDGFFGWVDAEVLYAMVRILKPARMIEVGAGNSTRITAMALRANNTACTFLTIDPEPRSTLPDGVPHLRALVQSVSSEAFALGRDDILFIDSSHFYEPGSDVEYLLDKILPILPAGAVVHVHDIFLPYDYPADWAGRYYTEQYRLAEILETGDWEVLWSGHQMMKNERAAMLAAFPGVPETTDPGSFWMRRR